MGIHDSYGKGVLDLAANRQFRHWLVENEEAFEYPSGGIIARLDGIIGHDCVVEVAAVNEKQIRGGMLDLVFHPRPKKLLVIVPVHLNMKSVDRIQAAYQGLLDYLINTHEPSAAGRVVVLRGTGNEPQGHLDEDSDSVRGALEALGVTV